MLVKLAKCNGIQGVWVWGHMGIDGSEVTDELDKVATGLIREWTSRKHEEHWQSVNRGKIRAVLRNPQQKELGNCSA